MRTILSIAAVMFAFANAARADIYQWAYINPADPSQGKQQSATLCPDGAGADAVQDADLRYRNLTMAYLSGAGLTNANGYASNLTNADLSQANLSNANFAYGILTGTDLSQANLTNALLGAATLTDADFTGAEVRGADFGYAGITPAQLYSTASYQSHDLSGISLRFNFLAGGNFAGQNLTNAKLTGANLSGANFRQANLANAAFTDVVCGRRGCDRIYATLTGADLTAADVRGERFYSCYALADAITTNLIWPDVHINGLVLDAGGLLVVRDHDGYPDPYYGSEPIPVTVDQHLTISPGGTLRLVFEVDAWDSTISFAPGIPVALGGTLELTFAADVHLASQVGRTLDLFDWTGVTPTGAFAISSPYVWDLSKLYTTGEVTLTAVPEPSGLFLLTFALVATFAMGRATLVHRSRVLHFAASAFPPFVFVPAAQADIFQ